MPESSPTRSSYFTTHLPADDHLWTAGFFDERFPGVVSPLGWSVVRRLIEPTAFREPLNFIGYQLPDDYPLTKLYRGHVYTNAGVFQRLYRVFPRFSVPRDAGRYFPVGDVSLRDEVPPPDPLRFTRSVLQTLLTEPGWHPFNFVTWQRFVPAFDRQVAVCRRRIEAETEPVALLQQVERLMELSLSLLRLHRWSLTYADVLYDLLRRLVAAWADAERAGDLAAELISGLPNKSTQTDRALWQLAELATRLDASLLEDLQQAEFGAFLDNLAGSTGKDGFRPAFDAFLDRFGHRSPSLDVRYPAYADEPAQVLAVVARLLEAGEDPGARERAQRERRQAAVREIRQSLGAQSIRWPAFEVVLWFTQRYTMLRENQRFYWQKSMHAKRRAFASIGCRLAAQGTLAAPDDVFSLTLQEVAGVIHGWLAVPEMRALAAQRRSEFEALRGSPYPAFLRGREPLVEADADGESGAQRLAGLAASSGRVRGPALVVAGPASLDDAWRRVSDGHILVASSTDPAWTPLFLRVSGLVMERGGQLSHGAVVAREYGLPAVVGVAGALDHIADGQFIEVDGGSGMVTLLPT